MILLIDNYDSFVYNLARYIGELGHARCVKRNDAVSIADIQALRPSHIIISPGPCRPEQAGISMEVVRQLGQKIPILGVCLGHQAIGQVYGATIARARYPQHGKASPIIHDGTMIFQGIASPLRAARYHSLIVSDEGFPAELQVLARCEQGEVMALRHRRFPVIGVQFHPESILTDAGHDLLRNFLQLDYDNLLSRFLSSA